MTCFWNGIIEALTVKRLLPRGMQPMHLVIFLKKNNVEARNVLWNNSFLSNKEYEEHKLLGWCSKRLDEDFQARGVPRQFEQPKDANDGEELKDISGRQLLSKWEAICWRIRSMNAKLSERASPPRHRCMAVLLRYTTEYGFEKNRTGSYFPTRFTRSDLW